MVAIESANVVVFIPLPVELGLAPINIRNKKTSNVAVDACCILIIWNPALLKDMELKSEMTMLLTIPTPFSEF